MHKRHRFVAIILLLLFLLLPAAGIADFGDFSGGSDYGGSSDSWSSSSSDSWSSSDSYGDSGGELGPFGTILMILFVCYLAFKYLRPSRKSGRASQSQRPAGAAPTTGLQPLQTIYQWDPTFSAAQVQQRLSNLYVQMQNCWQAKDLSPLRADFTDQQYAQFDRQLQRYRDEGLTNVIERISVLGVELTGVKQDDTQDILVAAVRARITDYVINDSTRAVVRGSKTAEKFMEYEYTLVRPKGKQTIPQDEAATLNCPNCGAPVNINQSAQCAYCNTIITRADYDWVIAGIKGLSQKTVG